MREAVRFLHDDRGSAVIPWIAVLAPLGATAVLAHPSLGHDLRRAALQVGLELGLHRP
jgi:hypothetical protein